MYLDIWSIKLCYFWVNQRSDLHLYCNRNNCNRYFNCECSCNREATNASWSSDFRDGFNRIGSGDHHLDSSNSNRWRHHNCVYSTCFSRWSNMYLEHGFTNMHNHWTDKWCFIHFHSGGNQRCWLFECFCTFESCNACSGPQCSYCFGSYCRIFKRLLNVGSGCFEWFNFDGL